MFRPPLTIRCVEALNFGRSQLIGTHIISSIDPFIVSDDAMEVEQTAITIESDEGMKLARSKCHSIIVADDVAAEVEQVDEAQSISEMNSRPLSLAEQAV